jgi:CrcB protein
MYAWIAVGAGGALGSVARHAVNKLVHQEWPMMRFPLATIVVNLVGCAVIGMLAGLIATGRLPMRANWREFVFVGVLGGFTTFSTFGLDTIVLLRSGDSGLALLNVLVQVVGGLAGVYLAFALVEHFTIAAR